MNDAYRIVTENQRAIAALSKDHSSLFLNPVPPAGCAGNVEHYFHFLFDLALPIFMLIDANIQSSLELASPGPFSNRIQELFPHDVRVVKEQTPGVPASELIGMNPGVTQIPLNVLQRFAQHFSSVYSIPRAEEPQDVLLIERIPPDNYYLNEATIKGGGSSRRSILNHSDLANVLKQITKPPRRFHNLKLEQISLAQQITLFSKAHIVIGQHGAGLSNCIWMNPGSVIIEINSDDSLVHFENISGMMGHRFFRYPVQNDHTEIDIGHFSHWLIESGIGYEFSPHPSR